MNSKEKHTLLLKQKAKELGFAFCGIAKAEFLEEDAPRLERWLKQNRHGEMHYMENHFDKRLDPSKLMDGAKTVVSLMYNYFTDQHQTDPLAPKISKYAYGEDYHFVVKDKLNLLLDALKIEVGDIYGRVFVDSAPILERAWARKSGIGWIGKNGNLINKTKGSYFFLAELILDLELLPDNISATDHCGTCTACIDACPTKAIVDNKVVDGSKCISYFTIELKDEIPANMKGKFENWMFGCDICQVVCPWNRFSIPHSEPRFMAEHALLNMTEQDWMDLTALTFGKIFKNSAVKRTKYNGLKRNIVFLKNKE